MLTRIALVPLAAVVFVAGCATVPTGPNVMVMPGPQKSFEQFQADQMSCQQYAQAAIGGASAQQNAENAAVGSAAVGTLLGAAAGAIIGSATGQAGQGAAIGAGTGLLFGSAAGSNAYGYSYQEAQRRYDIAYTQCMYGKGHQIPALASPEPRPAPAIPPPAAQVVPDLRGTWTGTWAQRPMTLLLLKQEEFPVGSVYIGPWAPFAQRELGLSGILTFTVRDEAISVNVRGRFAGSNGGRALVLEPLTANGQQIVLTRVERDYLSGVGTSRASWEPSCPVELDVPCLQL